MSRLIPKTKIMKRLREFLGTHKLMTVATVSGNKPWAATVFFVSDKNCNILFFSREDTRHARQIKKNPSVAIAIGPKKNRSPIQGVQIAGKVAKVSNQKLRRYYALYASRYPWADDFASDHTLFVVHPKELQYIDEKLFGHFYRVRVL